jgi:uncharacterized protein YkwD
MIPLVHCLVPPRVFALHYTEDGSLAQRRCIPDGSSPDSSLVPPGSGRAKIETGKMLQRTIRLFWISIAIILGGMMVPIALPAPPSVVAGPIFSDISQTWALSEIEFLASQNLLQGYADGTFRPTNPITRAEFTDLVVKSFSSPLNSSLGFVDLSSSFWAASFIARAQQEGWVNGFPDGTFRPQEPITIAQAIAVLVRIADWPLEQWLFPTTPSSWAASYLAAARGHQIIRDGDPYFHPDQAFGDEQATREEVAAFVARSVMQTGSYPASSEPATDWRCRAFLDLIGQTRSQAGLPTLIFDPRLAEFANSYVQEMGQNHFFSHDSPISGDFTQRAQVLFQEGYLQVGENLGAAADCTTAEAVQMLFAEFMSSPAHRSNILGGDWTRIGLGFWDSSDQFLLVLTFGCK